MHVIVVGAGIVGLASAYWLARDGHAVTVIDRETEVGRGASYANGAQLSYSYVAPMASPSVLRSLPKWLLRGDSPVRFAPGHSPAQWRWLLHFLRACNAERSALTTAQLLALAFSSRDSLHAMMAEAPLEFRHARNGKLVIQSSREGMAEAARQVALQAAFGCEQHVLGAAECLDLEPGLASIAHRLAGGVYTPSEEVGDCRMLCEGLRSVLQAPPYQVAFRLGTEVRGFPRNGRRIEAVRTASALLEGDLVVLASGAQSASLARAAGVSVAVQPVRGYSVTARVRAGNRAPVRSITDSARKTVYAPLGETLRVAGFAEIGGRAAPDKRADSLLRDLDTLFPGLCELTEAAPWSGLRPLTPTGLPLIGATLVDNLFVNVGQGALGFTLAAGSGRLLADLIAGRTPSVPPEPYAPRRALQGRQ